MRNGGMKYEDECEDERTFGRPLGAIVGRKVRTENVERKKVIRVNFAFSV